MASPKTFKELLEYLKENPEVVITRNGAVPEGATPKNYGCTNYTFSGNRDGGLWFIEDNGTDHYMPIDCGKTPSETGVEFFDNRFEVTKFGVTFSLFYKNRQA